MVEVREAVVRLWQLARTVDGILDILLVWLLVYAFLSLLKGARTQHLRGLATGLGALGVLWALTRPDRGLVKLDTFNWLLTQMAPFAFLALVIVFQPEIRQSFSQLGQVTLFGRSVHTGSRSAVVHLVNELVEAVEELSVRRIGALVAIQRADSLDEVVETGKKLDAEVSAELLTNLFFPNTPLHDGAVVLHGTRAVAAACLLPLTERRDLHRALGTRHRAAIGLTERCDAVVVVVSEETGTRSLSRGGELQRGLSEEELKVRLFELLGPGRSGLLGAGAEGEEAAS
jgi:diadenylate cyclase